MRSRTSRRTRSGDRLPVEPPTAMRRDLVRQLRPGPGSVPWLVELELHDGCCSGTVVGRMMVLAVTEGQAEQEARMRSGLAFARVLTVKRVR